jgi:hypothetical protein
MKRIVLRLMTLGAIMITAPGAGASTGTSCDNDPCTNLPYSFTVTVDGGVVPHMDSNVFGTYQADSGAPTLAVTPETYVTNPDGTMTGTVTAQVSIGLSVTQALGNDVTVYFEGGIMQDGHGCPDGPCTIPSYPCTLPAGQVSASCEIPEWWQSYWSGFQDVGPPASYNVIFADPGQPDRSEVNGHPNSYGWGFTIIPAFVPPPPAGSSASALRAPSASSSFKIRYHPVFGGNFTLYAKHYGVVVYHRFLGWRSPGVHTAWFDCGTHRGRIGLVVIGTRHDQSQHSQTKHVWC